tara:strand:- start:78 stop:1334 length:1257 start_codon:yes stop_codon:yes gene_type:complete
MKVLFVSINAKPGFELSDALFVEYFKKKINITFCAFLQKYYKQGGFYSYDKKFVNHKAFKKLKTVWLETKEELKILIIKHDIIIFSPVHGSDEFADFAKRYNKKVITIDSGFTYDFHPNNKSDLIFFKGINSKKTQMAQKPKSLKEKNILLESCLQSEFLKRKYLMSRKKFFKKYKIKKKKFVLFLPTGPQYHNKEYIEKYYKICKYLIGKNFHVLLKLHPTEYNINKITKNYSTKISSDVLTKSQNVTLCEQSDFYSAIKYAKHIFSTHTTAYVEVNLMKKPIIFIDRLDFFGLKNKKFYKKRNKLGFHNIVDSQIANNTRIGNQDKEIGFKYFGQDIEFHFLNKFLKKIPKKISKKLEKKIIKNNYLYCANYDINFYYNLRSHIIKYLKYIKINTANKFYLNLLFYKIIVLIKKNI